MERPDRSYQCPRPAEPAEQLHHLPVLHRDNQIVRHREDASLDPDPVFSWSDVEHGLVVRPDVSYNGPVDFNTVVSERIRPADGWHVDLEHATRGHTCHDIGGPRLPGRPAKVPLIALRTPRCSVGPSGFRRSRSSTPHRRFSRLCPARGRPKSVLHRCMLWRCSHAPAVTSGQSGSSPPATTKPRTGTWPNVIRPTRPLRRRATPRRGSAKWRPPSGVAGGSTRQQAGCSSAGTSTTG